MSDFELTSCIMRLGYTNLGITLEGRDTELGSRIEDTKVSQVMQESYGEALSRGITSISIKPYLKLPIRLRIAPAPHRGREDAGAKAPQPVAVRRES